MNKGEYIILEINLNKYIITSKEVQCLYEISLTDAITDRYHSSDLVSTHQRSQVPIDSIFISLSLLITTGGYFSIGMALSDHRAL